MRLSITRGFARECQIGTVGVKTANLNADLKGWEGVLGYPPSASIMLGVMNPEDHWFA